ncbi:MAG: outer membrane protein assembly factor BamD [Bryobacterales bacterium]|nr:outer membrane protein assembly factor BamD [Bryobacterales bacterium]
MSFNWNYRNTVVLLLLVLVAVGGCRRKKYENPITKDTQQPDKILFDKAIGDIERGRYEVARLTLNTLMNTYDTSEYLAKAKLAIADSWYREGGAHGLAQAEAEYKDFILFYPTLEESAEAQFKVCDLHYKQMEKPDRDPGHVVRADEECRQLLTQFPNSRYAPMAQQRLREIQEVSAESEFRVGSYYHHKQSYPAAANRLQAVTDHYPLYSAADLALSQLGDSYARMGPRFKQKSILAYQKIVREYPLSPLAEDAKKHLGEVEAEIPEPDPVALARMKYEQENVTPRSAMAKTWGVFSKSPDVSRAAKSGQPANSVLRPTTPASVPVPGGGAQTGTTDVTVSTVSGATTDLDTKPDARLNQPAQGSGEANQPAQGAQPAAAGGQASQVNTANTDQLPTNRQAPPPKKGKQKKK